MDGRRTGMVVTALMLGAGVFFGLMVSWLRGGGGLKPLIGLAACVPSLGFLMLLSPPVPPVEGLTGASLGARAGFIGANLAAGAGVGAGVFGVEDSLSCPPAIEILWNSLKNAAMVCSFMH